MDKSMYLSICRETTHWFNSLDRRDWMMVLLVGMSLSFLCMRGFGGRQ